MMRSLLILLLVISVLPVKSQQLPLWKSTMEQLAANDWLIQPLTAKADIYKTPDGKQLILFNGLIKRTFVLSPNVACTEYKNMSNGQQLIRAITPEAVITINDIKCNVGGLYGQTEKAYFAARMV